jgi:hypothetical protein
VRKPISEKTVAQNVLKHGTGGINIDECRIEYQNEKDKKEGQSSRLSERHGNNQVQTSGDRSNRENITGRFPANLIHDGSEEVVSMFPETQSGMMKAGTPRLMSDNPNKHTYGKMKPDTVANDTFGDSGSAARFFYCAKPSQSERNEGLEGMPLGEPPASARSKPAEGRKSALGKPRANHHPTVKSLRLMIYLVKMITPKKGKVLDPFMGSGTTGCACRNLDMDFIGIDKEKENVDIAKERIFSDMFAEAVNQ